MKIKREKKKDKVASRVAIGLNKVIVIRLTSDSKHKRQVDLERVRERVCV